MVIGTFVAYWLDFGLSYVPSSVQWPSNRIQIVFAAMLFVGAFNLPESPRWLIARGRDDEAKHVLFALEGETANKEEIELEARIIRDAIEKTGKQGGLAIFSPTVKHSTSDACSSAPRLSSSR